MHAKLDNASTEMHAINEWGSKLQQPMPSSQNLFPVKSIGMNWMRREIKVLIMEMAKWNHSIEGISVRGTDPQVAQIKGRIHRRQMWGLLTETGVIYKSQQVHYSIGKSRGCPLSGRRRLSQSSEGRDAERSPQCPSTVHGAYN